MGYILTVVRKDNTSYSTKFEGYEAETYSDKAFRDNVANKHTMFVRLCYDDGEQRSCWVEEETVRKQLHYIEQDREK